jgi:ATP-dependent DNA helicase DinG
MPDLADRYFSAAGHLCGELDAFSYRPCQLELARVIDGLLESHENALLEAGTGTGKTLAYLIPILENGGRTIISTGTRALQDQLYKKDIPSAIKLTGINRRVAVLKGRSNYLCPDRLNRNISEENQFKNQDLMSELKQVQLWSFRTRSGDLNELADFSDKAALLSLITSTRANCLGQSCPSFNGCPVYRSREKAMQAEIVVVNHHILWADLALKDDQLGQLLPMASHIIVDEAHQVPDVARFFFGNRLSSSQLIDLGRDLERELDSLGRDDPELRSAVQLMLRATRLLRDEFQVMARQLKPLEWINGPGSEVMDELEAALAQCLNVLALRLDRSEVLRLCYTRASDISDHLMIISADRSMQGQAAQWLEFDENGFQFNSIPSNLGEVLAACFENSAAQWLFLSATLSVNGSFEFIKDTLGLEQIMEYQFESPFDFQRQVMGFIPSDLPAVNSPEHCRVLMQQVTPLLTRKALLLFTSFRALAEAKAYLETLHLPLLLVQGDQAKSGLIDLFMQAEQAVLVATQSFWEGVDFAGANLCCLLIDKLPFASPAEPMVDDLAATYSDRGKNPFMDLHLPKCAVSLRQGFGRLIRQETDKGLFILGDNRIFTKPYGQALVNSLPNMEWTQNRESALKFYEEI